MTTAILNEEYIRSNTSSRDDQLDHVIDVLLLQFDNISRSYVVFNILFLGIGFLEFFMLVIFFAFLAQSAILATSLAFVFLTFFSYFILRIYLQTKKPEQLRDLADRYVTACKNLINYQDGMPEHCVALARACAKFAARLQGKEYTFYCPPSSLEHLKPYFQQFSYWCHWHDIHRMKEQLLKLAVQENTKLVKCEPTNPAAHTALANAYILLSGLYISNPEKPNETARWDKYTASFQAKYRFAAERAIQEFNILKDFSPNDPWAHMQLAYSYRDLKLPKEEMREYEAILKLTPSDADVLFKLGKLYFQEGMNAQGLRIYDQLNRLQDRKAEELIKFYGTYLEM